MEKRYSIKDAFVASWAFISSYKMEFLKFVGFEFLAVAVMATINYGMVEYTSLAPALKCGIQILQMFFILAYTHMFLQHKRGHQPSFMKSLTAISAPHIIKNYFLGALLFMAAAVMFFIPVGLIGYKLQPLLIMPLYKYGFLTFIGIVSLIAFYYLGRYGLFFYALIVDENSVLEALEKNYALTTPGLMAKLFAIFLLFLLVLSIPFVLLILLQSESLMMVYVITMGIISALFTKPIGVGYITDLYEQLNNQ